MKIIWSLCIISLSHSHMLYISRLSAAKEAAAAAAQHLEPFNKNRQTEKKRDKEKKKKGEKKQKKKKKERTKERKKGRKKEKEMKKM